MSEARHPDRSRVLVVGGGFAGLWAVRTLVGADVSITLVDRTNHHLFQPLLYEVATAGLPAPDIAAPLRSILRNQDNVTVLCTEVDDFHLEQGYASAGGLDLPYDYMIVATGCTHSYFGHDDWARWAPGLKTLDDAIAMRARILSAFEAAERETDPQRQAAWLRFVVIGGGPTGVELAGTMAEIAHRTLPREFRRCNPASAEIHLIEAGPRVLAAMTPSLSEKAQQQLQRLGVFVHTGSAVTGVDSTGVWLGERRISCRTVLWAAGVAASPLGRLLSKDLDRQGRVKVQPDLSLPGHPEVFVAGDLASVSIGGRPVPGVAPAAKQMGRHAAQSVLRRLQGRFPQAFVYKDLGNLATVGRSAAVVELKRLRLWGLPAWLFWLGAHLWFLIGFRNRLLVMINWSWAYFTRQRPARVMLRAEVRR